MTHKHLFSAIFLIAACAIGTTARGQNNSIKDCPAPQAMKAEQLFGQWTARFTNPPDGLPATADLLLQRHAEFSDSLAGSVRRNLGAANGSQLLAGHAARAALAGDLEDGMLLLDESSDNISITGTWNAEMVQDSCGRMFSGVWKDTSKTANPDAPAVAFTLQKLP